MTLLTAKTRTVEPLDFSNPEHRALLFDLAVTNADHLLNDVDNDILLIIAGYEQRAAIGELAAFVALVDDEPAGCFWLEIDRYGIGRVRGALLPDFKDVKNLIFFLKLIVAYGFEMLELRKLDAELTLYNKRDKQYAAAERVLKKIGFQKRAIIPEALMVNGKPKDTVLLDYLKRDYHVQRQ